ncbi:polysaccharide deacetylase family protein [Fusobacterium animalis]|uniref:polysaccharide deacetylase family protein n=1 Tax=Fusobacterium animalis TaxID=76859 RepID=UPI001C6E3844|nr:polysaccharide deacetylase family protein [Fusobacterium animalis]QYR66826.1 polysaccharide deacetylase family protein [Fusobacterium animalis]
MMIFILIIFVLTILLILFNKRAVPVFLYHQVNPISSNVSPELFEEHLKIIKKYNMETITISEYYNKNINKNSMLLTFDDGYYDNFKYVFPLLKKYNMKATIFLNTLYIMDKRESEPKIKDNNTVNLEAIKKYIENGKATINQYMSWEEIKEMYDSGLVDFQAHSHKHMAIFTNPKIEGLTKKDRMEAPELYLYGELEDNLPIFAKRGEYSGKAKIVKKKFFNIFKDFYEENIENKITDKNEILKKCQEFIDKNSEYFSDESEAEYKKRIEEDYLENKKLIEKNVGNKVKFFCWPWGHRSKETIKILKELGVIGFISTKKGTNSIKPNWDMIRRIELRKYTPEKFKINLLVTRNLILGKIYGWIS